MLLITRIRILCSSMFITSVVAITGCSSESSESAYYRGNEEAVREHMKEVESEERAHAREVGSAPPAKSAEQEVVDAERSQRGR